MNLYLTAVQGLLPFNVLCRRNQLSAYLSIAVTKEDHSYILC